MFDTRKSGLIQSSFPSLSRNELYVSQAPVEIKPAIRVGGASNLDKYGLSQDLSEVNSETVITAPRVVQNPSGRPAGADIAINGGFDNAVGWTLGDGWTIALGVASSDGTQAAVSLLTQTPLPAPSVGQLYSVTFEVTAFTAGTVMPVLGLTDGTARAAVGVFTEIIAVGAGADLSLEASADFVGSVDHISIKRAANDFTVGENCRLASDAVGLQAAAHPNFIVNGGFDADTDWTKAPSWTIAAGVATSSGAQIGGADLTQVGATLTNALVSGATYTVTFTVSNYTAGEVAAVVGDGTPGTARVANGTYTEQIVAGAGVDFDLRADVDFDGNVDNVSVKQDGGVVVDITQWQLDLSDVVGEVQSILTLDNIQLADAGSYTCDFTNASGTVSSDAVVLTVVA